MTSAPTDTVLIANRGEIALRILRACRVLELRAVCVTSEADRAAPYLKLADRVVCLGPTDARKSYLNSPAILSAARITGAGLVHPGHGFLSENAAFAEAVAAAGLVLIGPDARAMRTMGDKVATKSAMVAAGVPCVPGPDCALPEDAAAVAAIAARIGYPVILKAAGDGGGRGMGVVRDAACLESALMLTRQEAKRDGDGRRG
jgi:acetyl-CoA carboxylase biotin carboxylase subunit